MNLIELLEELEKLKEAEFYGVMFNLLKIKKLRYEKLTELYVKLLETEKDLANKRESLMANCIATGVRKPSKKEVDWYHSQVSVLIKRWVPDEFIEKHCDKKTPGLVKKNLELLK